MKPLDYTTDQQPHVDRREYGCSMVDAMQGAGRLSLPTRGDDKRKPCMVKSEGERDASAVGCNVDNANAGRYLNGNNACSNDDDNYAGAFAETNRKNGREQLTSRPTRSNKDKIGSLAANGGQGQHEYESLPFWSDIAESGATPATAASLMDDPIWEELRKANSKRNLKGLSKFYHSTTIAVYAVKRCCKERDTARKREYYDRAEVVAWLMIREITTGTYHVRGYHDLDIPPRFPSGKHRAAKVFTLYDRCVQMFVLTIIEIKLRRKVLRNNYSNITGRGIFCKDKKYCMLNQIRTATWKYPHDVVLLTDIKKFYDNVGWKVMCAVVFETVKDPTTRMLILLTLKTAGTLPIGSCLSPLFADILMNDFDETVLREFKPHFFAAFGDNRLFICEKEKAVSIQQFAKSYYPGRYGVQLKDDYQIKPISSVFSFCKTQYDNGYTRVRAELKRRAIRVALKPQQFAGYYGMLLKTDSRHLLHLMTRHTKRLRMAKNSRGIDMKPFAGDPMEFDYFKDHKVCCTNYKRIDNHKDSGYYYVFQFVMRDGDKLKLYNTHNGSFEIKAAGDFWISKNMPPPIYVTVRKDGKGYYFEEYHTTNEEACAVLVQTMDIKL